MEESISLEETNKIRISLGLKPLTDDSVPTDDKEKQAETNYAKRREEEAKQRETKYVLAPLVTNCRINWTPCTQDESRIALPSECYSSELPCRYFYHFLWAFRGPAI
jgi:hypothetical protein